jgi:hypothetical protein
VTALLAARSVCQAVPFVFVSLRVAWHSAAEWQVPHLSGVCQGPCTATRRPYAMAICGPCGQGKSIRTAATAGSRPDKIRPLPASGRVRACKAQNATVEALVCADDYLELDGYTFDWKRQVSSWWSPSTELALALSPAEASRRPECAGLRRSSSPTCAATFCNICDIYAHDQCCRN